MWPIFAISTVQPAGLHGDDLKARCRDVSDAVCARIIAVVCWQGKDEGRAVKNLGEIDLRPYAGGVCVDYRQISHFHFDLVNRRCVHRHDGILGGRGR